MKVFSTGDLGYKGKLSLSFDEGRDENFRFSFCGVNKVVVTATTEPEIDDKEKITWSGLATGTGESITIDLTTLEQGGELTATVCGVSSKIMVNYVGVSEGEEIRCNEGCNQIYGGGDLTGDALRTIVGWSQNRSTTTEAQIDEIASYINDFAEDYGIDTPEERYHFYVQIAHETGGLRSLGERRSRYASSQSVYKGRGILQLTGSRNYRAFQNYLNENGYNYDIMTNPNLVATDMELATLSAVWYWDIGNNVGRYATDYSNQSLLNVSKQVNCGSINSTCGGNAGSLPNGWIDRQHQAERIIDCMNE